MFKINCLNPIADVGLKNFSNEYQITADIQEADGVLVRSASMHGMEIPESLLAVARAGAGVNNIPLDECAEKGVVVFNTPGANANGVKELVLALNDLNEGADHCLLETDEREAICELIQCSAEECGLIDPESDVTEEWREW